MMFVNSLMWKAYTKTRKFVTGNEEGASLAEYAMLLGVVTVALIASIGLFSGAIKTVIDNTTTNMTGGGGGAP